MQIRDLALISARARLLALDMVHRAASGHLGGSLSAMDLLTTLYFDHLCIDPQQPQDPGRDRFVLSKGHCTPALYPILALRGFFPLSRLEEFRRIDGHLSGHAEMRHVPGVDMSTGSLGQGLSAAVGMALAGALDHRDYRTVALLGDGELEEGQVWEAVMAANKYHLARLCAIVDVNGLQIDGPTDQVMPTAPLDRKFAAFGWNVAACDGHDFASIRQALLQADREENAPTVILAKTVKGKGVSFMENQAGWHGKAPNDQQYADARAQLQAALDQLEGE